MNFETYLFFRASYLNSFVGIFCRNDSVMKQEPEES